MSNQSLPNDQSKLSQKVVQIRYCWYPPQICSVICLPKNRVLKPIYVKFPKRTIHAIQVRVLRQELEFYRLKRIYICAQAFEHDVV